MKIFVAIVIVILAICLAIAEGILFDFYQQTTANKWSYFAFIPFLAIMLLYRIRNKWKYSLKEGRERIMQAIKYGVYCVLVFAAVFYFMLTPVISGSLLLVNSYLGTQKEIRITGTIEDITAFSMQRSSKYAVEVQTAQEYLIFESNGPAIKNYNIGSKFDEIMEVGSLGLITKQRVKQE